MAENKPGRPYNLPTLVIGTALVLIGLLFLLAQLAGTFLHVSVWQYLWPFFVIVPGVLLFAGGVTLRGESGIGLAIAGSIVTMVGLILLFQAVTGLWASWSYAWALIAPTSVGLGLMLFGAIKSQPERIHSGMRLTLIGLALFVGFAIFFELIIGVSGFSSGPVGRLLLPILVIGAGVAVLAATLLSGRRKV